MARQTPFQVFSYSISRNERQYSGLEQLKLLQEIKGRRTYHHKRNPTADDNDTFVMFPREEKVGRYRVIIFGVGQDVQGRVRANYDQDLDQVVMDYVATNGGIKYAACIAIPALARVAIADSSSEYGLGAKSAAFRFESVINHLVRNSEARLTAAARYADIDRAIRNFDLYEFSFSVRPSNPHIGRQGAKLDAEMKKDGIRKLRGTAVADPEKPMRMNEDGYIEQAAGLAAAGYGQIGLRARTAEGAEIQFAKPQFSEEKRLNEAAQRKPQSLRIFISGDLGEAEQYRAAARALIELYGE